MNDYELEKLIFQGFIEGKTVKTLSTKAGEIMQEVVKTELTVNDNPDVFLIELNLDFGNYYKFSTNFYLEENLLNFSFFWNDMEDYYNLVIYSDNAIIWEGTLRFFAPIPRFFGYHITNANLKPNGSFVFLPTKTDHPRNEANIRIKDLQELNFKLFFIKL